MRIGKYWHFMNTKCIHIIFQGYAQPTMLHGSEG
jgi:hypothetical protein